MIDLIISQGIGSDGPWATYERRPNGSLRRVRSPKLPLRMTREEAERDLQDWLVAKVWHGNVMVQRQYGETFRQHCQKRYPWMFKVLGEDR